MTLEPRSPAAYRERTRELVSIEERISKAFDCDWGWHGCQPHLTPDACHAKLRVTSPTANHLSHRSRHRQASSPATPSHTYHCTGAIRLSSTAAITADGRKTFHSQKPRRPYSRACHGSSKPLRGSWSGSVVGQ